MSGHGRQIVLTASVALVIAAGIGVGVYYIVPQLQNSTTSYHRGTTSSSNVLTYSGCNNTTALNGTEYCTLNVSNETLFGNPGYSVFNNNDSSISFNGVTFTLLCPSGYIGCPNTSHNSTTVTLLIGVIALRLTFPNNTTQYVQNFVPVGGVPVNVTMLSNNVSPSAGMYIELVQQSYETFLLVQETSSTCGPFGCDESSTTSTNTLLSECSNASTPNSGFGTVVVGTDSPAIICVQFYFYNSTTPLSLNLSSTISVQGWQDISINGTISNRVSDGMSNFTLTTSSDELVLGGPANESEGITVAYALTAKSGASGTYELGFLQSWGLGASLLGETCGFYGEIVAGNGQPNYAQNENLCVAQSTSYLEEHNDTVTMPGIGPIVPNDLYFRVVGVSNST